MKVFPDNARVCFLGDSITHNNGYVSRVVAHYCEHFPQKNVKFYNCGVSGGTVNTLRNIFDDDIVVHSPTHAVIMIGINDSGIGLLEQLRSVERYEQLENAFERYKENLAIICDRLTNLGAEIILCTQTPYDEYQHSEIPPLSGGFALMAEYASYVRMLAAERGYGLCDFSRYFVKMLQNDALISEDRVHPNDLGQYHMAKCFLEYQGLDIGDYIPHPEYMERWRELVAKLRNIYAAEHFIVDDYSYDTEQHLAMIADYLKTGDNEYFLKLAREYLENKPHHKEIAEEIDAIMESSFGL